jgi:hypothetical protein
MSGLFHSEFWTYYLPQLCQTVPVVRHAAAAVAARHEYHLHSHTGPKENSDTFALQQYNKAIRHLIEYFSKQDQRIDITLITCFLFVGLEMLCGNPMQALNHMHGGVQILYQHGRLNGWASCFPEDIENELLHLALRLNLQLSFFGRRLTIFEWDSIDRLSGTKAWSEVSQARYSLDILMNKGLQLSRDIGLERPLPSFAMIQRQNTILSELHYWEVKFDRLMRVPKKKITSLDPRIPLSLRITHHVSSLLVRTCLNRDEFGYDEHNGSFEEVVCNAEKWVHFDRKLRREAANADGYSDEFTLEAGIVPMLYWTATKCRNSVVRRRAIEVLQYCPVTEGLWTAGYLSMVAAKVIDIEERNVNHLPLDERVPSDKDRAYEVFVRTGNSTTLPNRSNAQLLFKPDGCDGPWVSQTMYIP